jgi:hypothetical protein
LLSSTHLDSYLLGRPLQGFSNVLNVWPVGSHPMAIRDSPLDFLLHTFSWLPSFHGYHATPALIRGFMDTMATPMHDFPFHPPPSSSPLITMATPAGGQWVVTYPTDPYYPKLLPTKPQPILTPHNILSNLLHPSYKNWAAISQAPLL